MYFCQCYKENMRPPCRPKDQSNQGKSSIARSCLTSCHTQGTRTRKAARVSPVKAICPGVRCARRPHIHTSALYCSFHCGHGKSQCGTEWEEVVARAVGPARPAMLGISLLTHTDLHMEVNTHNPDLRRDQGGSSVSTAVLTTPQWPRHHFQL